MHTAIRTIAAGLLLPIILCGAALALPEGIDWRVQPLIALETPPIDVAAAEDGELVFVLSRDHVLVYADPTAAPINRIPVDGTFDRIGYAEETETLLLTSSVSKTMQRISIQRIHTIETEGSPFRGPVDAAVTIAVFDDYQCPFCARLESVFDKIAAMYPTSVRIVIKHFPIRSHPFAEEAALAAMAAHQQGKFWPFHAALYQDFRSLNEEKIQQIAARLQLNMDRFERDRKSPDIRRHIINDVQNGRDAGVRGTPTVFINGKRISTRELANIHQLIENELKPK